jgi:hypothetical protein
VTNCEREASPPSLESQHFLRAYQLSELRMRASVQNGETKTMLPSSLIELIERFLGTRAVLTTALLIISIFSGRLVLFCDCLS